jgi:hypothetical protein
MPVELVLQECLWPLLNKMTLEIQRWILIRTSIPARAAAQISTLVAKLTLELQSLLSKQHHSGIEQVMAILKAF